MFIFPPNPPSQTEHVMNNLFQQQDLWLAYQCGNYCRCSFNSLDYMYALHPAIKIHTLSGVVIQHEKFPEWASNP